MALARKEARRLSPDRFCTEQILAKTLFQGNKR